jgi:hypothetical protein
MGSPRVAASALNVIENLIMDLPVGVIAGLMRWHGFIQSI